MSSAGVVRLRQAARLPAGSKVMMFGGPGKSSMVSVKHIQDLADRIAREFHPDKIILFGSYAGGEPSPDSDVDLLVILPHRGKNWRVAAEIRGRVRPEFPIDLLVRAPQEIRRRVAGGDPFLREIADKGKVLYESHHG